MVIRNQRIDTGSLIGVITIAFLLVALHTSLLFAEEKADPCPLAPMMLNTYAQCETPYVDPRLVGVSCGNLFYDFDGCDPCDFTRPVWFRQVAGPGQTDSSTGIWRWNAIPSSVAGDSFEVRVCSEFGDYVSMTVTIQSPPLDVNSGFSVMTLKTGQTFGGQMSATPSTCTDLNWSFHQFAGDPTGVFTLDQNGVYTFSASTIGLYTYMVNVSNGVVSDSIDPSFIVHGGNCCTEERGNANNMGIVDLSDLSLLVSYLTSPYVPLGCLDESNVNGLGIVDLTDLSTLVSYLTGSGAVLPTCP